MYFPRYWARAAHTRPAADGRPITLTCWGWSDESAEAAQRKAYARAKAVIFIAHDGDRRLHPEIAPIVALHDKHALPARNLPLA